MGRLHVVRILNFDSGSVLSLDYLNMICEKCLVFNVTRAKDVGRACYFWVNNELETAGSWDDVSEVV